MAITAEELQVKIEVESQKAQKGLEQVRSDLDKVGKQLERTAKNTDALQSGFAKVTLALTGLNQGLQLAKGAYNAVAAPIQKSIDLFKTQEAAETELANALKITGEFTEENLKSFKDFASQLQENSTIGDETTLSFLKIAKSMSLTDEQAMGLVSAAADLSAATGKGLDSSFQQLLKTFGGFAGELGEALPAVKSLTQAQLKAGEGITLVGKQFAGFAKAQTTTVAGALKQAENAFGDLGEEIGQTFAELINLPAAAAANKQFFNELISFVRELRPTLIAARDALVDFVERVKAGFAAININAIAESFVFFGTTLGLIATPAVASFLAGIATSLAAAVAPAVLLAAKFIAIAGAIAAVAGAIDIVIRNFDRLDTLAVVAGNAMLAVFERVKKGFKAVGLVILQGLESLVDSVAGSFLDVGGVAETVLNKIRSSQLSLSESIDETNLKIDETDKALVDASQGADFGFLGQIFKEGKKFAEVFNQELDNSSKGLSNLKNKATEFRKTVKDAPPPPDPQALQTLQAIIDKNNQIRNETANIGALQTQTIQNNLKLALQQVEAERKKLELQGKLTPEIEKELQLRQQLLEEKAQKETEQAVQSQMDVAFKPQEVEVISNTLGAGVGSLASSISSFASPVTAFAGGANLFLDGIQQLIDFVPQILDKITNIFNSLTDLPAKITESLGNLIDAVFKFLSEGITNVIKELPKRISQIFVELPRAIQEGVFALLDSLPTIITEVLNQLPEIITEAVEVMISNAPLIAIKMVEFVIKDAPKIAFAIAKALAIDLPKAIVKGIIEGLLAIRDAIKNLFTGAVPEIGKQFEEGVKNLVKQGSKVGGQLFKVLDIQDEERRIKAAKDFAVQMQIGAKKAGQTLLDMIIKAWRWVWENVLKPITELVQKAWLWVWENVLKPIAKLVEKAWKWVWENVLKSIGSLVRKAWLWVWTNVLEPIVKLVEKAWKWVWENVLEPITHLVAKAWRWVWDNILQPVTELVQKAWLWVWTNILEPIVNLVSAAWKWVIDNILEPIAGVVSMAWQWVVDNILSPLAEVVSSAWMWVKENILDPIAGVISTAWQWVVDNILSPLASVVSAAWIWVKENIIDPLAGVVSAAWQWVIDNVISPIAGVVSSAWQWVVDNVIDPLAGVVSGAWQWVVDNVLDPISSFVSDAFAPVVDLFNELSSFVSDAFKPIQDFFDSIDFPEIPGIDTLSSAIDDLFDTPGWLKTLEDLINKLKKANPFSGGGGGSGGFIGKVGGAISSGVKSIGKALGFNRGGLVQAFQGGGLVDSVPSLLTPGEFVINKPAVDALGTGVLGQINQGQLPSTGNTEVNVSLKIESRTELNEAFIRNRLMPAVKEELKRASLDGVFLFSDRGIR